MSTRNIEELRSQIDSTKAEMMNTANELEQRVEHLGDWRSRVRENPVASVAISIGAGFLLAMMAGPAVRGGSRALGTVTDTGVDMLRASIKSALAGVIANELHKRRAPQWTDREIIANS